MNRRPEQGIATDGAHSAKERLTRYRAVDLSSGRELFLETAGNATNNIGEFLAIVASVRYLLEHPEMPRIVYSDSVTAIAWYKDRRTASSKCSPALSKAEVFLKVFSEKIKDVEIRHWDKALWGEIPADFGNKNRRDGKIEITIG